MNIRQSFVKVRGIEATIRYKAIKNIHLNVLPPIGKVRVSAPSGMSDDAIRTFLAGRISWIKKKQSKFKAQERQTPREYISGESHYFLGNRYKLEVIEQTSKPTLYIKGKKKLILSIKPRSVVLNREQVVQDFYRRELRQVLEPIVEKWKKQLGVELRFWGIRRMKTRWGTCDKSVKSIWFNLELIKKPKDCIHYVVVHELIHLIERKHNDKFVSLMDEFLPKWRSIRDELNFLILAHENWN